MKKFLFLSLILLLTFRDLCAMSVPDSIYFYDTSNPMHDLKKDCIRILDIGNSYTDDATHYLPNICKAAGVVTGYSLYKATRASASFKSWVDTYYDRDTSKNSIQLCTGDTIADIKTGLAYAGDGSLFRNALKNGKWDLILIHQVSTYANDFESWNGSRRTGYLKELIQIIRETNPQATIGFYLVHSYRSSYGGNTEKSSYKRWKNIADAARKLCLNYGIDFVIPYGTAVQNLRATSLCDANEFSSDGTHLASGLGDYVAACCYWQTVFAPRTGISILGNSYRNTDLNETSAGVMNINDETAIIAQKAAVLSVMNKYQVLDVDSFDYYVSRPAEYSYYDNNLVGYNYNPPAGDVSVPDSIYAITRGAFNGCDEILSVTLPKTLQYIGNYAFKDCSGLASIKSFMPGKQLFEIDHSVFLNVDKSKIALYVPFGSAAAYASAAGWSEFENIIEMSPETFSIEITDAGYETLYVDYNAAIPDETEVFVVNSVNNGYANLERVYNVIPARTGVIVKANPGKYQFLQTVNEASSVGPNLLKGTLSSRYIECGDGAYYVLSNHQGVLGFYSPLIDGATSFLNNANKAYLFIENARQIDGFRLPDGGTTSISNVNLHNMQDAAFDITGRHVKRPSQGFYIIGGKKVFLK